MVIGQNATIDTRCRQAAGISGAHSVVDALGAISVAAGNANLQIDDVRVRTRPFQLLECRAPYVIEVHGSRDRTTCLLCQMTVVTSPTHKRLVNTGIARMRQYLVNVTTAHPIPRHRHPTASS